ncbi:breast carcinoma-amplified sequence 1 isoform X2 [Narcine bancroftii]|uniref:breast carcinoma-amplified sequence 1 isoform X2 n=1 Tax=Narcine bancroftii TaxID=1343680 RepID=UPI003830FFDD
MGNVESHEPLNDSGTEPSALKQSKDETDAVVIQNGQTLQSAAQNSVQDKNEADMWRFDYLMRKLHLKSRKSKVGVEQDPETLTSQKTMEMSSSINAEEKELEKSDKAGLKSRFSFSFTRSVPGRTDDSSTEPKSESAKLPTNRKTFSVNTASIDKVNLQQSSSHKGGSTQKEQHPSTESFNGTELAVKETEQLKQKEVSFFDKLFKQSDKSETQNGHKGDVKTGESQDLTAVDKEATKRSHRLDKVHQYLETGDGNQDYMTSSNGDNIPQNPASAKSSEKDSGKENKAGTPADDNSVMNFFKTLVTPTRPSSKAEFDSHQAPDDKNKKVNGEHKEPAAKAQKSEQPEVSKTKDTESSERPKSPQSPFGKLFKQKTAKEPQFEQENVTSTPDGKEEKSMSQPQKQISKQGSKDSEVKPEEAKPAKKPFLNFFKQTESSPIGDPATKGHEVENSVEPQKTTKDNTKQKKSVPEINQEETRQTKYLESLPPTQQQSGISEPRPNGSSDKTKETPEKRLEKKQSFGMFLKQLGGKKTADVAVQTDPVVIHPAGKAK